MNKLSLRMKLSLGFGSLSAILAAMGCLAYTSVGQLADTASRSEQIATRIYLASQIETAVEKRLRGFAASCWREKKTS
ncbi:MAG: hypothetical protein JWQ87_4678 [Candidatus Sulfotelmatobacter sp.]|nr:hypothetical protein [Candidatus Sulfotelmatobacter sp.]